MLKQIQERIEKSILDSDDFNRGFEFRMSMAGDCVLKICRDAQDGKKKPAINNALRMGIGHPIHNYWRDIFEKAFGEEFEFAEKLIELEIHAAGETIKIPGHADGAIRSLDAAVEFKSVSDSTFTLVQNNGRPLPAHGDQANLYAHVIKKSKVLYVYCNRDSGEFLMFLEDYSLERAQSVIRKWTVAIEHNKNKSLPERPYHDATASPCFFCDWRESCYAGFADQVSKMGAQEVTEPRYVFTASQYSEARIAKLLSEKLEDEAKSSLAVWMIDHNLNQAKTEFGVITLKIGVKNNPLISIKPTKDRQNGK